MTPAKPQMSGQKDDPDDLIAELTKLMATDGAKVGEVPAKAPPTENGQAPAVPQSIRIPGMARPVAATPSSPAPSFDPVANLGANPPANRQEPSLGTWRPALAPGEAEVKPAPIASSFDFDFGFNRERPVSPPRAVPSTPAAAPRPVSVAESPTSPPPAPVPAPGHDPIADLIAAELRADASLAPLQPAPAHSAPPAAIPARPPVQVVPSAPPAPAMAEPVPEPIRPAQPPRSTQENDRFTTAPVFGLGNRPAGEPVEPKAPLDPMDEIENLIGEAVRVELNMPQAPYPARGNDHQPAARMPQQAPQPSPVVPPLGGQFAPRRTTSLRDAEGHGEADAAILAAAAAAGHDVGRIDADFVEDRARPLPKAKRRDRQAEQRQVQEDNRRRLARDGRPSGGAFRQLVVPAIAGTILVAGALGLYWALGMGHNDGKAPILTANAAAAKTVPPKTNDDSAPRSVVMEQLSGDVPAVGKETLVSRDQTAGADAQVAAVAPSATNTADNGLSNRKVRTVTVRPDGTIVSSDDSVAGAEKLPVARPNVPAVPGMAVATAGNDAPMAPSAPSAAAAGSDDAATLAGVGLTPVASAPAAPDTAAAPSVASVDSTAPVPMPRFERPQAPVASADPTDEQLTSPQPNSPVNAVVRTNSARAKPMDLIGNLAASSDATDAPAASPAARAPRAQPADTTSGATSVAHVQLASQPSAASAQASANTLQKRFGNLFGGGELHVVKVDLSKGTYYRVVLPTSSLQDAQQVCASIKSGGGDCLAANG